MGRRRCAGRLSQRCRKAMLSICRRSAAHFSFRFTTNIPTNICATKVGACAARTQFFSIFLDTGETAPAFFRLTGKAGSPIAIALSQHRADMVMSALFPSSRLLEARPISPVPETMHLTSVRSRPRSRQTNAAAAGWSTHCRRDLAIRG